MSDGTRLRGDGEVITMADGAPERIRFDFDALCEIEELFGSLSAFTTQLGVGSRSSIVNTVAKGVTAALRHLPEPPSVNDVRRRLDSRRINEYLDALDTAFYDAMPEPRPSEGKEAGETTGSPGPTTTTSAPSGSVAATASSGE